MRRKRRKAALLFLCLFRSSLLWPIYDFGARWEKKSPMRFFYISFFYPSFLNREVLELQDLR